MLYFKDTEQQDLTRIIQIEKENTYFICPYTEERHLEVIQNTSEKHVSVFVEDRLIGFIILLGINSPNRSLEFRRIVIVEKGKGYGRKALRWIKEYCFETLKFHRLWFDVFTDNERGIYLYESEGFQREGELRDCIVKEGRFRSLFLYAMLEADYRKGK